MTIEISNQLSEVLSVIERHLESTLLAVHLYGSAVDGGLKPYSDIDLLVTVAVKLGLQVDSRGSPLCALRLAGRRGGRGRRRGQPPDRRPDPLPAQPVGPP